MIVIALLIMISLSIALAFLLLFLWNLRSGQYDDTHTPSVRMLFDDGVFAAKKDESITGQDASKRPESPQS